MTFEELLRGLPRQTSTEWAARAEREWRGRPGAAFAKTFGRGAGGVEVAVGPFVTTDPTRPPVPRPSRPRWVPMSDLRPLGDALTAEDALAELAGGAQGLCLDAAQLPRLAGSGGAIRYDYLALELHGADGDTELRLREVVPEEQRAGTDITYVPASDATHPGGEGPTRRAVALPVGESAAATATAAAEAFERGGADALAVALPTDYLAAVALLGALDLLWDRAAAARGASPAPLHLSAHVAPTGAVDTPEAYLVDASVRALAAVSAGVDALVVTPFSGAPAHRRQARNLPQLLLLEAGFAERPDVLAGAAWFEEAAGALARAAWASPPTP